MKYLKFSGYSDDIVSAELPGSINEEYYVGTDHSTFLTITITHKEKHRTLGIYAEFGTNGWGFGVSTLAGDGNLKVKVKVGTQTARDGAVEPTLIFHLRDNYDIEIVQVKE